MVQRVLRIGRPRNSVPLLDASRKCHEKQRPKCEKLPVEIWSLVLSFLDNDSLVTIICVNRSFNHEAEIYLYRSVTLDSSAKCEAFIESTQNSARRRERVRSLTYCLRNVEYLSHYLLVCFPNITHLALDHGTDISALEVPPTGFSFRLLSLQCDPPDITQNFVKFLAANPSIQKLDIVTSNRYGHLVPSTVLPNLTHVACTASTAQYFVRDRPVSALKFLGWIDDLNILDYVIPTAVYSSVPVQSLRMSLDSNGLRYLARLAQALPLLEHLHLIGLDFPVSSFQQWISAFYEFRSLRTLGCETNWPPSSLVPDQDAMADLARNLPALSKIYVWDYIGRVLRCYKGQLGVWKTEM